MGLSRILVVEDEAIVAFLIEDMLTEMGYEVAAIASRMQHALELAKTETFDLAVIDVNLDGQPSYPIAEILRDREIPFIFATGYGAANLNAKFADAPVLTKPFEMSDLQKLLHRLLHANSPKG